MFGWLSKNKDKKDKGQSVDVNVSHLSDAKQQLFEQLRAKRDELGEDTIAKMQKAAQMQKMKNKIKFDIENDEDKRNRLLDEIRFGLKNDK